MSEVDYVFACKYCGSIVSVQRAVTFYSSERELDDGRMLVTMSTYCSEYCADRHVRSSISAAG